MRMAHLGSYLFHELTTPLGLRLDAAGAAPALAEGTPFRSLGPTASGSRAVCCYGWRPGRRA